MAYAGKVIENPVSGERITFHKTAAGTDGEMLEITLELSPDGAVPGLHVHPTQTERFEIQSGRMKFRKGFRTIIAEAGDVVTVEPGTAHKFTNDGDEPAIAKVQVTPALRMEELFETAAELAQEGRTNKKGMPKPLDFALFTKEFRNEVVGAFPPVWVQRATLAPLAYIASKRGNGARYTGLRPATA